MSQINAPMIRRSTTDLDQHYGQIGISALAAAIRYKGETRNPAYSPAIPSLDERLLDE